MVLWLLRDWRQLKLWIQLPLKYVGGSPSVEHRAVHALRVFLSLQLEASLEKGWGNEYHVFLLRLYRNFSKGI